MRLRNLWRPKEKFLILDISPRSTKAMLFGVDDERRITPEKFWDDFSLKSFKGRPLRRIQKRNLIVAADSALVTSVSFPIELKRDPGEAHRPISLTELETILSQEIGKLFNSRRREASVRLGRHELDTILVNAKAENFKIDRHLVMNPVGFAGKTIAAVLELDFTTRDIFESFKDFFSAKDGFFFTESGRAGLTALAKLDSPPVNLILLRSEDTPAFILEKAAWGTSVYREKMDWPLDSMFEAVAAALSVNREVVLRLYHKFLNGDMSDSFKRAFFRIMKPEIDKLFGAIHGSKLRGRVYLHSPVPFPVALPVRHGRVTLHDIPVQDAMQQAGFTADLGHWPYSDGEVFMRLAPFLEFYYDKSDSEINHKLRRRLHWLIQ